MNLAVLIGLCALFALAIAAAFSWALSAAGPVDRPRARGAHQTPTPTSGGLAFMAAMGGAALLLPPLPTGFGAALAYALALAVALGALGGLDDVLDLPAPIKLGLQLVAILAFAFLVPPPPFIAVTEQVHWVLPGWIASLGVALWLLVVLNAVNFMDGSNGLVAGSLAIVFLGFGLMMLGAGIGAVALVWIAAGAALIGFLPFNFPKARVFQGDAGALFIAALLGSSWILVIDRGGWVRGFNLVALPIALLPFLTDVLLTLLARARRGARLMDAHKEHLYQRWLAAHGGDHAALARRMWAIVSIFTLFGVIAATGPASRATAILVGATALSVSAWWWIDRQVSAKA